MIKETGSPRRRVTTAAPIPLLLEEQSLKMDSKKCCNVNLKYLPIKTHYFFAFGAMAGAVPFMPVLAKGLGINATAVGLIYTVVPFCVFLSKPLFGYLTDYFRNIKVIMLTIVTITSLAFISVLFVPVIESEVHYWEEVQAECGNDTNQIVIEPISFDSSCLPAKLKEGVKCELRSPECLNISERTILEGEFSIGNFVDHSDHRHFHNVVDTTYTFLFRPKAKLGPEFSCECLASNVSSMKCKSDAFVCPSTSDSKLSSVYESSYFWIFASLVILAGTGASTMYCLSDAACCEVLGQHPELYGRQRLWATISWGIITLLAGFLNDIATGNQEERNYSPGFYILIIFTAIDIFILWRIQLVKAKFSTTICKDVSKIFSSCRTVVFAIGVYIAGAFSGLLWSYQFWFLEDLGASQTLLGLTIAIQCLLAEVPLFFFSGWFIKRFGHFYCLIGTFIAFALRFGFYTILMDPWMTLPVEVLHGVTFGIFYATMTSYANDCAPPGTEATMLGALGGIFEGLGVATGSLLGGVGFDKLGDRQTFFSAGIISLICVPLFLVFHITNKRFIQKAEMQPTLRPSSS